MLYSLGGENLYLSILRLEELKDEFQERFDGIIQMFNMDEIRDCNEIISDADSFSIFSKKKLIIIKRLFSSNAAIIDKIYDYIKSANDVNFIFWEDRPFDKRRSLYKLLKKKGIVEEFTKLKYVQLKAWLSKYLSGRVEFDPECIETLILKVGDDQMQLALIVENLVTLVKADGRRRLILEDVNKFVEKTAEENIWEFVDALGECDKAKALDIIERLLREKQDFMMIVGMIARQFRILAMVKYLQELGKNHAEITSVLKLHPFVVRKSVSHCRNFSFKQLRKLYQKLVKTDLVVKEGRFDDKLALDLLIAAV